jgi:hypothetical protein
MQTLTYRHNTKPFQTFTCKTTPLLRDCLFRCCVLRDSLYMCCNIRYWMIRCRLVLTYVYRYSGVREWVLVPVLWRMPLVEQELLTIPEHLSSPLIFSGICVARFLVLCVCFVDRCLSFFFGIRRVVLYVTVCTDVVLYVIVWTAAAMYLNVCSGIVVWVSICINTKYYVAYLYWSSWFLVEFVLLDF